MSSTSSSDGTESAIKLEFQKYYDVIDADYAVEVASTVASFGSNPDLGYWTAGSAGELLQEIICIKNLKR